MLHINLRAFTAFVLTVFVSTHFTFAQQNNKYDQNKPFGWATCTSLSGGNFNLCGGEGGKSVTLKSDGKDMTSALANALKTYDIVILDGSKGPFIISQSINLYQKQNKSLLGINGATLQTNFQIDDVIKAKLDSAEVKKRSTKGNGGILSNGIKVREEMEFCVRQFLIDYYDDPKENFRKSGILKIVECDNIIVRNIRFADGNSHHPFMG